jgi:hypothetical protein
MNCEELRRILGDLDIHRLDKRLRDAGFGPELVALGD